MLGVLAKAGLFAVSGATGRVNHASRSVAFG